MFHQQIRGGGEVILLYPALEDPASANMRLPIQESAVCLVRLARHSKPVEA